MANNMVKCPICAKQNKKDNTIKIGRRYYCPECAEQVEEDGKTDWDKLFDTICRIYGITKPNGMMFKQLKEFRSEPYNYTDGGMEATLCYIYDILGLSLKDGVGLGIIPYYYEECKNYYMAIARSEDSLANSKFVEDIVITNLDFSARNRLLRSSKKPLEFTEDEE